MRKYSAKMFIYEFISAKVISMTLRETKGFLIYKIYKPTPSMENKLSCRRIPTEDLK